MERPVVKEGMRGWTISYANGCKLHVRYETMSRTQMDRALSPDEVEDMLWAVERKLIQFRVLKNAQGYSR